MKKKKRREIKRTNNKVETRIESADSFRQFTTEVENTSLQN